MQFFTSKRARSKLWLPPTKGRRPWSQFSELAIFLEKDAWLDSHCA